jgi:hypothetical protein
MSVSEQLSARLHLAHDLGRSCKHCSGFGRIELRHFDIGYDEVALPAGVAGVGLSQTVEDVVPVDRYRRLLRSDRDDVVGDAVGLNNQRPFELRLTHGDRLGSKVDDAMVFGLGVMLTSILIGIMEFRHQVARLEPGTLGRRLRVDLEDDCSGRPNFLDAGSPASPFASAATHQGNSLAQTREPFLKIGPGHAG